MGTINGPLPELTAVNVVGYCGEVGKGLLAGTITDPDVLAFVHTITRNVIGADGQLVKQPDPE